MAGLALHSTTKVTPQCYAYTTPGVPDHDGWTKIGFTERDVETRVKEQVHTANIEYKIWWSMQASYLTKPFGTFTDKDFHSYLTKKGVNRRIGTEWFEIDHDTAKAYFLEFVENHGHLENQETNPVLPYTLREEQNEAVERALAYFKTHKKGEFLWNAKPRFGKTLSAYELCKRLEATNILIVTNRPAIANSWYSDYETFIGPQSGYFFVSNVDGIKNKKYVLSREQYLNKLSEMEEETIKGCIEFVSLQDLKGSIYFGGPYDKLSELSKEKGVNWDLLIIDEAHEGIDTYKTDVAFDHISYQHALHLSGTPFKALANDKFPSDAIFNWTYADEQKKKRDWDQSKEQENPYENLPRLSLLTYQMSELIRDKVKKGITLADQDVEEYAFDLNEFFKTKDSGKFVHDKEVNRFLDALTTQEKFPFSTTELREELKHTFWLLNRVSSAKALAAKLKIHPIFKDYEIVLAAGDGKIDDEKENTKAFDRVRKAIDGNDKTITISVGQLTTGVTIPEWSAVLMLSNMSSPSLYMQAAFRAQNPYLFHDNQGKFYRKKNAYVFDFDPARTLTIFEQFANDLIPQTSEEKKDFDQKKKHVRELLNFFPVYGEDEDGKMVELDAEKVLTVPRHIHAKEVVERGFMSNFLFANISGIFSAPSEVIDLINNMQAIEEPKPLASVEVNDKTKERLNLNDKGEVEYSETQTIGLDEEIFGEKFYDKVNRKLDEAMDEVKKEQEQKTYEGENERDELEKLKKTFSDPLTNTLMERTVEEYGSDLKKSTQQKLERELKSNTDVIVNRRFGDYKIKSRQLEQEHQKKIREAQEKKLSMDEISKLDENYQKRRQEAHEEMTTAIKKDMDSGETIKKAAKTIIKTVESEKRIKEKEDIEGKIRDHLRGFSRTIPAFLMAYGDEETTLENFDQLVPEDVFWEVTANPQNGKGVTLEDFRFLRDGGDYYQKDEEGNEIRDEEHLRHFDGHLFDEVVFNDAVVEFMKKRQELANYFDEETDGDIFDYIPPQRTNQIFTPKAVVKDMVDKLEEENPGSFDDPEATFADLYMKSGMYITEIVTRLYQSSRMKALFPDPKERLNHIFEVQVYGCAPTEIIYRICLRYILGFSDQIQIKKHNIKKFDTLPYAKNGTLSEALEKLFNN